MHPVLFKFGSVTLFAYGLFIAIGFLTALSFIRKEAVRRELDPGMVVDLGFLMLLFGVVGGRVTYILINWETFLAAPLEVFQLWKGGLVFYGGFIGALVTALIYVRQKKMAFLPVADVFTPGLAVGHAIGRIGCFFAGCCYGRTCDLPWAITFHNPLSLAPLDVPLHPSQLYEAGANFLVFCFLWFFRKKTKFAGQLFWLYVLLYGLMRAFLEIFRGDPRGAFWGTLSVSQGIGLALALSAAIMLTILSRRATCRK